MLMMLPALFSIVEKGLLSSCLGAYRCHWVCTPPIPSLPSAQCQKRPWEAEDMILTWCKWVPFHWFQQSFTQLELLRIWPKIWYWNSSAHSFPLPGVQGCSDLGATLGLFLFKTTFVAVSVKRGWFSVLFWSLFRGHITRIRTLHCYLGSFLPGDWSKDH